MGTSYFDEGQIDINEEKEVVTNEFIIKVCPCLFEDRVS